MTTFNRRQFVKTASSLAVASFFIRSTSLAAPSSEVHDIKVISQQPEYYCGWPTVTRRVNGELLVVWSGGREEHVCPFGRVDMMRSHDSGDSWTWPRTLLDGPIDDRDAGIVETAKGTLLATTFTSLAYDDRLLRKAALPGVTWPKERIDRWMAAHTRISADQRKAELGEWMIRSTDGGITWSARYPTIVNSPHGPIQLSDGRLLYAGKKLWNSNKEIGVAESKDDGATWEWLAEIPTRDGDQTKEYHELHAVEAADGTLIAHIRNHNKADQREILQSESKDGGQTWSMPHSTGVWGLPSFLTHLRDGRLLMSYGYRRPPFGNQACVSEDNGQTWSESITISADGVSGDLGYPSTVELEDGTLLTVWYENMADSSKAVLRQARWELKG